MQGYKLGREDALGSLEEEIRRQTKAAYAEQVLAEESTRAQQADAEAAALTKRFQR